MTVGIAITNGLEAIVITDCRVSGSGRQSDSFDKMGIFRRDNYVGVLFGAGNGNLFEGVTGNLNNVAGDSLELFVANLFSLYKRMVDELDERYLESQRQEIEKQAKLISKLEEREQFIKQKTAELRNEFESYKKNQQQQTFFMLVAYDKQAEKIRMYGIDSIRYTELFHSHEEIGSGTDGANLYFSTKLQGVDTKVLSRADLVFFGMNAHSFSTVNQGVGGTPKIAIVNKDGYTILPTDKIIALANASSIYLSEYPLEQPLTNTIVRDIFREILKDSKPHYGVIAKELGVDKRTLTEIYVPYSSWQARANRKLFRQNDS